ncbi:MAG: hypothetical protein A2086_10170 [Spirochaetes bacterium GWD1_27_9]|nr:MAG: hypothetical protein A2Z98_08065 [Spirochaetes bacterium GWB1_27_13]OHD35794.1 MAG: hypothetical protein A2086_10170 [Spirochaetes bacterium GWD1_27_9]
MKKLDKIFKFYDKFHKDFIGDVKSLNCGPICSKCEANCEVCSKEEEIQYKYICVFLPYEVEYVAYKLNIPLEEFKNKYVFGIKTPKTIINVLKFERECPFLNKDFSCGMGENKIISCKIYPIIHYPVIEFNLSKHCDLTKDHKISQNFLKGVESYKKFLKKLKLTEHYRYLRESFDILQLEAKKAAPLLSSNTYDIIELEDFKKLIIGEPSLI